MLYKKRMVLFLTLTSFGLGLITITWAFDTPETSQLTAGLGYANILYPEDLKDVLEEAESHFGGLGFNIAWYVPLPNAEKTVVGVDFTAAFDTYTFPGIFGSISMSMDHQLLSFSSMHFFGNKGTFDPFVKVSAGLSRMKISASNLLLDVEATSNYGFGFLLGGGVASTLSKGKVLFNVDYSFRSVEEKEYHIFSLSVGYLFSLEEM